MYILNMLRTQSISNSIVDIVIAASSEPDMAKAVINILYNKGAAEIYKHIIEKLKWPTDTLKKLVMIVEGTYSGTIECGVKCIVSILQFAVRYNNVDAIRDCLCKLDDKILYKCIKQSRNLIDKRHKSVLLDRCEKIVDPSMRNECLAYLV